MEVRSEISMNITLEPLTERIENNGSSRLSRNVTDTGQQSIVSLDMGYTIDSPRTEL